jgi:putative spermidine/putrescine transport system ATP-binding protein
MGDSVSIFSLTKLFSEVKAVDDVSLMVKAGEFMTFLGPSGSGKTTLLLMVAGFHTPTSGEVCIGGKPVTFVHPNKRNIGMVFQNYALFPHMSVYDNIAFSLKVRRMAKDEIEYSVKKSLDLVKLKGYEWRYPNQLSGGQQQRVALARALVYNPRVLLMDEPLGALDKKLREYMQLEIKRIQENLNITIIYVTHDQEEALTISDSIAVMNHGKIEQVGNPEQLYEEPTNKFVADFIGESNFISGKIVQIEERTCVVMTDNALKFRTILPKGVALGKHVQLAIRPERIFFLNEDANVQEQLRGVIQEKIYIGESLKYIVRTEGEELLTINKQNAHTSLKMDKGEVVHFGWNLSDVKVFVD